MPLHNSFLYNYTYNPHKTSPSFTHIPRSHSQTQSPFTNITNTNTHNTMADEIPDSLPLASNVNDDFGNYNLLQTYKYTITFDIPTSVIIGFSLTLFFCILYHILYSLFYWLIGTRMIYYPRDVEEGTSLTTTASASASASAFYSNYGDDPSSSSSSSHHVAIFQALVHSNLQAWLMVGALMEESSSESVVVVEEEKRGERLRVSKKLPPLVKYGSQQDHHVIRNCGREEDCAICLEDFKVGEWCQVFPACNHVFHSDCIDCWLAGKLTCPTCRCHVTD